MSSTAGLLPRLLSQHCGFYSAPLRIPSSPGQRCTSVRFLLGSACSGGSRASNSRIHIAFTACWDIMSHTAEPPKFRPFGSDPAPRRAAGRFARRVRVVRPPGRVPVQEGSHLRLYEKLGSHPTNVNGTPGYQFTVWAANADYVSVVGDFNGWDAPRIDFSRSASSGVGRVHS